MLVYISSAALGINRLTTVSWATLLSIGFAASICVAESWLLTRGIFLERNEREIPFARLRRAAPSLWMPVCIVFAIVMASLATYLSGSMAGVFAQHVNGDELRISATVNEILRGSSGKNPCRRKITVVLDSRGESLRFCAETSVRKVIAPDDLKVGSRVVVAVNVSSFGSAVTAVDHAIEGS